MGWKTVLILMMGSMTQANAEMEYPKWLDREEFPFDAHFFETPQGHMHYVDEGEGEPIVMAHGNPGWGFEFREVIKAMSPTNRCIAADLIGFGLSDKPESFDYKPQSQAALFESFLESLDLNNITLVVNDWGGPIGLHYAIKHPERIKRLVILNTFLWSVKGDPHFEKFSSMMGGRLGKFLIYNFNFFGRAVVKKAVGDKKKLTKNIHRHYYKHMATRSERKGSHVFPGQIIGASDWLEELWSQRDMIKHLPAAFVWGMKDIAFREQELNKWSTEWPDAKVVKLPEVGHFPQEEAPDEVIRMLKDTANSN